MKKQLCVLMGGLALVSLASCGDEENPAIAKMVSGKDGSEVANMIIDKYSDTDFLETYLNKDIKLGFDATVSFPNESETPDVITATGGATIDIDKGASANALLSWKSGEDGKETSLKLDAEYERATDDLYLLSKQLDDSVTKERFVDLFEGISLPSSNNVTTVIGKVKETLAEFSEVFTVNITKSELELTFKTDATMNYIISRGIEGYLGEYMDMTARGTNIEFTLKFNQNLMFTGAELAAGTTLTSNGTTAATSTDSTTAPQTLVYSVNASASVQYGTFTYTELADKSTYVVSTSPAFIK